MLALFPGLSLLVSTYGLFLDPAMVEPQLEVLRRLLPEASFNLIAARLHELAQMGRPGLGLGAAIGGALALWGASSGVRAMTGALNMAHRQVETRSFLLKNAVALLLTLGAMLAICIGIALLVALPTILGLLDLPMRQALLIRGAALALMMVMVLLGIAVLYRFGPARRPTRWRLISPGTVVATGLWAVASVAFSFYVSHLAGYDRTYGPLGTAVGLLMWFYVSVYVVLLGAEIDAGLTREGH
jgi:membrane protein